MSSRFACLSAGILTSLFTSGLSAVSPPVSPEMQDGAAREKGRLRFDRLDRTDFAFGGRIGESDAFELEHGGTSAS